jgi:hypothetical protein
MSFRSWNSIKRIATLNLFCSDSLARRSLQQVFRKNEWRLDAFEGTTKCYQWSDLNRLSFSYKSIEQQTLRTFLHKPSIELSAVICHLFSAWLAQQFHLDNLAELRRTSTFNRLLFNLSMLYVQANYIQMFLHL